MSDETIEEYVQDRDFSAMTVADHGVTRCDDGIERYGHTVQITGPTGSSVYWKWFTPLGAAFNANDQVVQIVSDMLRAVETASDHNCDDWVELMEFDDLSLGRSRYSEVTSLIPQVIAVFGGQDEFDYVCETVAH
jgi:ornithine carbamoyltransferase